MRCRNPYRSLSSRNLRTQFSSGNLHCQIQRNIIFCQVYFSHALFIEIRINGFFVASFAPSSEESSRLLPPLQNTGGPLPVGWRGRTAASYQWQEDQLTHKQFGDHQGKLLREKIEAMMVAKCRAFRPQTHKNIPERANVELHKCFHVSSTRF